MIQILRGLSGVNIVGADVVEVAPVYDTHAELTGLAAAGVVETLVELMVKKPVEIKFYLNPVRFGNSRNLIKPDFPRFNGFTINPEFFVSMRTKNCR